MLVSVYPSLHSCVWSHAAMPGSGEVCVGDLGVVYQDRQARFAELARFTPGVVLEELGYLDGHELF